MQTTEGPTGRRFELPGRQCWASYATFLKKNTSIPAHFKFKKFCADFDCCKDKKKQKNWEFFQTLETKSDPRFSASRFTAERQHRITQWSTQNSAGSEPRSKKNMFSFQVVELSFSFPSSSHAEHSGCGGELKDCTQTAKHSCICKSKLISIWFNVIYFTCPSGTEPHNESTSVSLKQLLPLFGSPLFGNAELVNISRKLSTMCEILPVKVFVVAAY